MDSSFFEVNMRNRYLKVKTKEQMILVIVAMAMAMVLSGCFTAKPDLKQLEAKATASPYDPQTHQALADQYYQKSILDKNTYEQNYISKALREYKKVLEITPNNAAVLGRVGLIQKDLGFYSEALKYLEQSLKLDIKPKKERKALAQLYYNEGVQAVTGQDYPRGMDLFSKVLRLDPGLKEARNNLAIIYYNLGSADISAGRYEAGIIKLGKALEYNPKYKEAEQNIGTAYAQMAGQLSNEGQLDKALEYFTKSLKIKSSDDIKKNMAVVYCKKAVALQKQRDKFTEAIGLYKQAIKCCPSGNENIIKSAQNNIKALEQRMKKKK
jgi:tetratricopeptide (TPR) repeat protein